MSAGTSMDDHDLLITLNAKMDGIAANFMAMQSQQMSLDARISTIELDRAARIPEFVAQTAIVNHTATRVDSIEDWQRDKDSQATGFKKMGGWIKAAFLVGAAIIGALGYGFVIQPLASPAPQVQVAH